MLNEIRYWYYRRENLKNRLFLNANVPDLLVKERHF